MKTRPRIGSGDLKIVFENNYLVFLQIVTARVEKRRRTSTITVIIFGSDDVVVVIVYY